MKVFFTNYHISVNQCFVDDLVAIGHEVIMPSQDMANGRIDFFAPNDEHKKNHATGVAIVGYDEFLAQPPMAFVIPCNQLYEDFMKLYEARGRKDVLVFLPALSNSLSVFPVRGSDFIISHDLAYHRATEAKYKMLYFNKPKIMTTPKIDTAKSFAEKKIKLYINNFDKEGFEPEYEAAKQFRDLWGARTGWIVPFYGYGMADGWLDMIDVQRNIVDSMFTLVFKRRETWGQMVNESMLLGTPCIFLKRFINSTFTEYLITPDTAIIGEDVKDLVAQLQALTPEKYESLCVQATAMSTMFCNNEVRRTQLKWLLSKTNL